MDKNLELALAQTEVNLAKKSRKITYMDRFISCLLDENGNPTAPKTKLHLIAEMSLKIIQEKISNLDLGSTKHQEEFKKINLRVKQNLTVIVSNSKTNGSLSFNRKHKDTFRVVKDGKNFGLMYIKNSGVSAKAKV